MNNARLTKRHTTLLAGILTLSFSAFVGCGGAEGDEEEDEALITCDCPPTEAECVQTRQVEYGNCDYIWRASLTPNGAAECKSRADTRFGNCMIRAAQPVEPPRN
jgi:hypothetical protein